MGPIKNLEFVLAAYGFSGFVLAAYIVYILLSTVRLKKKAAAFTSTLNSNA